MRCLAAGPDVRPSISQRLPAHKNVFAWRRSGHPTSRLVGRQATKAGRSVNSFADGNLPRRLRAQQQGGPRPDHPGPARAF
eukprot:5139108-Prorocentrum_lima.AAC.1